MMMSPAPIYSAPGGTHTTLRIMTYNVLGGRNSDGARDFERIANVIKAFAPDLVALQEVDRGTGRLQGRDLAAELGKLTGMHHAFGKAMDFDGGEYGEAVLSRWPIRKTRVHPLPHAPNAEPRCALEVEVLPPGWEQPLHFVGTHLDHLAADTNRLQQAETLTGALQTKEPCILVGDFNATPKSPTLQHFAQEWKNAWPAGKEGFTIPSDSPRRQIDYILLRPAAAWKVLQAQRGQDHQPDNAAWQKLLRSSSDHQPVICKVEWISPKNEHPSR